MAYTTINKSSEYFNTVTYSGNSSNNRTISGFGFDPDFAWVKCRTSAFSHTLADSVRGTNANLFANETGAEINPTTDIGRGGIGQVTTDGFIAVQGTSSMDNTNTSGQDYVAWSWLAGGTASSNTDGSITSNVSASTTSGFSIVKWTSTDTAGSTIGHGLGSVPKMIITKKITSGNPGNWTVYHNSLGNTKSIALNTTGAEDTATSYWNDTSPTSSVFSTGTYFDVGDYIAYCFAEKKGFSKFGSYTGNGSTDGTFVYTGFKPAWVMRKYATGGTAAGEGWEMLDNTRSPYNVADERLKADSSGAESTGSNYYVDFLSNGFKIRTADNATNNSGATYIYMAFAETPFVTSTGLVTTAR